MANWLLAGPLLFLGFAFVWWAILHLSSGPDEAEERERFRRRAELEGIRQEARSGWLNGPVTRRKPNRHDRQHGRRRGYLEGGL